MIILLLVGVYTFFNIGEYKRSMTWVTHTQTVILEAEEMLSCMQEMETAQRDYILTDNSASLKRYKSSVKRRDSIYKRLYSLVQDNAQQQILLDSIRNLYKLRTDAADQAILIRDKSGFVAARNFIVQGTGHELMRLFRAGTGRLINNERKLLEVRVKQAEQEFTSLILIIIGSVLLSILIILSTMYFFIRDFNKRRASQKRLAESELRLKHILNALPVGVYIVDEHNIPYYVNAKAKETLGPGIVNRSGSAVEIFKAYRVGSNDLYEEEDMPISKALHGVISLGVEDMEIRKGNIITPLRINAIPLYNSGGDLEYAIAVVEDISKVKEVEYELIEAKKIAENSLRLKEKFLANMSHEIRTPLNAIIGFTDILSNSNLKDKEQEFIKIIQASATNLLRIINDVLDISKIEAGMMTFEQHPLSIRDIFQSLKSMLFTKIKDKKISLFFFADEHIPEVVMGDPVRLTQILLNLIGNAVKFTHEGYVTTTARLQSEDEHGCVICFFVKDTGIGIQENKLQQIFERFNQVEHSIMRNYGGTGLGLSIAKQLVELQSGSIRATSKEGIGSEFFFTLPFKKGDLSLSEKNRDEIIKVDFKALAGKNILAVEDNPVNIKLLEHMFDIRGLRFDTAENGRLAIQKLEQKAYDIILMDMELPELNGYDTTAYIRNQMNSTVPIIAMTAHAMAGEREKCLSLGMNEYLSKPLNAKLLFEKMHLILFPGDAKHDKEDPVPARLSDRGKVAILEHLAEYSGGDAAFEREIITLFLQQEPLTMRGLQEAAETGAMDTVKGLAHKMKSSVSVFGMNDLLNLLSRIGSGADQGISKEDMLLLINELKTGIASYCRQLQQVLQGNY
jgi:signal transduction histidine kinase/DNA-binding response OmpR family regulator